MTFLLYGANGYTAQLMLPLAQQYGLTPILAGRSESKIKPLAEQYGLQYRIFDLADATATDAALSDVPLVLHCAGPFMHTARPMMEACLRTGKHYLDITGEIQIFEMAARMGTKAKERGILLMPGVGFDVVPTDCTALLLKKQLPDATHLRLAFANIGGGLSHGTAKTMNENLGGSSAVRLNGKITPVPLGHKSMELDFGAAKRLMMTIPWGDVSTAFYTTGIPNIETYTAVHPKTYRNLRWQKYYNWLLRTKFMRDMARKKIESMPAGPSDEARAKSKTFVWGEVSNAKGEIRTARLETPQGYDLTAHTALLIAQKVLNGHFKPGFWTPAGLFGENLILEAPGTKYY